MNKGDGVLRRGNNKSKVTEAQNKKMVIGALVGVGKVGKSKTRKGRK